MVVLNAREIYVILCVYNNKNNNYLLYIFIGLELYHWSPNKNRTKQEGNIYISIYISWKYRTDWCWKLFNLYINKNRI